MDAINVLIAMLKAKKDITSLEKDILDTWDELNKNPIDMESAKKQVLANDTKYPDIFTAIQLMPTTVQKSADKTTEADIVYNLTNQLVLMATKEWEVLNRGKQTGTYMGW